jgi:putative spermidine/putrescine transport system substrate-binding protein
MRRRHLFGASAAVFAAQHRGEALAQANRTVCYNCPPEWADWAGALRSIRLHRHPGDGRGAGGLRGPLSERGRRLTLRVLLLAPTLAVLLAFFFLPLARLVAAGWEGGGAAGMPRR